MVDDNVVRVHLFELLGSSERKWGAAGAWKRCPVELQERARLHFPYTTYYHVESVLQKRLKRQDHPLLIVSISIFNSGDEDGITTDFFPFCNFSPNISAPCCVDIQRDKDHLQKHEVVCGCNCDI